MTEEVRDPIAEGVAIAMAVGQTGIHAAFSVAAALVRKGIFDEKDVRRLGNNVRSSLPDLSTSTYPELTAGFEAYIETRVEKVLAIFDE